ncbi:MAG: type II toxin-antitoxin system mRNA interferase toxin, RelE/StbE family [Candidatus Rokuibacteriota bacterium]|nr:MAG: type II toxin-antitoxin system mRNA interferase toxin, RelE/StbE family [Candidatus Rokubacteria bacterium]
MAEYSVVFARSARRELEQLEKRVARRVLSRVEALGSNPRPQGCIKLQGPDDLWRIRIGDYRVIYSIDDGQRTVDIGAIRHRGDAYR